MVEFLMSETETSAIYLWLDHKKGMEFSPWAIVADTIANTGFEGLRDERMFEGLSREEVLKVQNAGSLLRDLVRLNEEIDSLDYFGRLLRVMQLISAYKRVISSLDLDDVPYFLQAAGALNGDWETRAQLLKSLPKSFLARLLIAGLEYGVMGWGLVEWEKGKEVNGGVVFGMLLAALFGLSWLEKERLEKGRWVTSIGAQMFQIAFDDPLVAVVSVRLGPLIRGGLMSLHPVSRRSLLMFTLVLSAQVVFTGILSGWDYLRVLDHN